MVYKWLWVSITALMCLVALVGAVMQFVSISFVTSGDVIQQRIAGGIIFAIPAFIWGMISWGSLKDTRSLDQL